jgi:hypothetical protein
MPAPLLLLLALPFPQEAQERPRGLVRHEAAAFGGYTLVAPLTEHTTFLIDMQGRVVHRWPGAHAPSSVYLMDDGSVLRCVRIEENPVFQGGGICGRIERVSWDGTVTWAHEIADDYQTQHHDIEPLPNGNLLAIVWEYRYREDVLAVGRPENEVSDKGFWPDAVLELRPTPPEGAEVVWEWHAWDHLVQDHDPEADRYGSVPDRPGCIDVNVDHRDRPPMTPEQIAAQEELERQMAALGYAGGGDDEEEDAPPPPGGPGAARGNGSDWLHTNAVDYDPVHDLVLLSSPNLSEIWIVDHSTSTEEAVEDRGGRFGRGGEILWRWGNPRNHGAGEDADRQLFFQHDAQWIAPGLPGAGHVLVFNNGRDRGDGDWSSVLELELPLEPGKGFVHEADQPHGPQAPVWSYADRGTFFGSFISGCQRLPNGNTLICQGPQGRVFEVTPDGTIVWEWWNDLGGEVQPGGPGGGIDKQALFRATRVAPDHPGLRGRTLAPLPR